MNLVTSRLDLAPTRPASLPGKPRTSRARVKIGRSATELMKEKKRLAIDDEAIDVPVAQCGVGRGQRSIRHRQERAQASGRAKYDHFGVWVATSR